ncbi:hypothetical protein PsorP6_015246 [Peronosclerospora sorghi]|uniref:Uncharacterized protein n=1 Tax=Peronosclerospora sorghi TaxID=230839 RepID=A0ACC0VUK6_9STRA|nr:hypothetical protein PsorP6_015246 [Peronosclerospora sorghi]
MKQNAVPTTRIPTAEKATVLVAVPDVLAVGVVEVDGVEEDRWVRLGRRITRMRDALRPSHGIVGALDPLAARVTQLLAVRLAILIRVFLAKRLGPDMISTGKVETKLVIGSPPIRVDVAQRFDTRDLVAVRNASDIL